MRANGQKRAAKSSGFTPGRKLKGRRTADQAMSRQVMVSSAGCCWSEVLVSLLISFVLSSTVIEVHPVVIVDPGAGKPALLFFVSD